MATRKNTGGGKNKINFGKVRVLLGNETFRFVSGLIILFLSVYLFISYISFFFTGYADQSIVADAADSAASNSGGRQGANFAHFMVNDTFGIASLFLVFYIFLVALRLMRVKSIRLVKSLAICLVSTIWMSVFFGFAFWDLYKDSYVNWGGKHGKFIADFLENQIGTIGTGLLLLFSALCLLIAFNGKTIKYIRDFLELKFLRKKKTKSLCEGYEEHPITIDDMFKRAAARPPSKRPGDSGFYELIWSFAVLRKKYIPMLFKHLTRMNPGRLTTLRPPKYGARLLCRVCLALATEESLKMILDEFSRIGTEVEAVDEFCKVLSDPKWPPKYTQAFLTQLSRLTTQVTNIEIVGPHLANVIFMHWNADQARALHANISSLLRAKISIAPYEAQTPDVLLAIGTLLKRTFDFLECLETHFHVPRVDLSSISNDCAVLASLFNTEAATCCFSSLLRRDASIDATVNLGLR